MLFIPGFKERSTAQKNREALVTNENKYISMLKSGKEDIIVHLMKIYFYYNFTSKQGLRDPSDTLNHWASEIAAYIEFSQYPNLRLDRVSRSRLSDLEDALRIEKGTKERVIQQFEDDMKKEGAHKMPYISDQVIRDRWEIFTVFYSIVKRKLINRIMSRNSMVDTDKFLEYLIAGASSKKQTEDDMKKAMSKFSNFSYLEDDLLELCKKYNLETN